MLNNYEGETKRLVRYLKNLDFLYKKEPNSVKSVITMVNHFIVSQGEKKIKTHHELAEKMLDYVVFKKVIEFADELVQDPDTHAAFMKMSREDTGDVREALVMDYMEPVPSGSIYYPKATLSELINFFRKAQADVRYLLIVDDVEGSLKGIVSVNDFTRNLELIKTEDKNMEIVELPFFNSGPKVILDTDKMEYAASLFQAAQQANKKITKLLVVNNNKKPVGYLAETELAKWDAISLM